MNTSRRRRALATTTTMTKESLYDGHNDDDAEPLRDDYNHEAEPLRFAYNVHNGHDVKPSRQQQFGNDAEADP